MRIKHFLLIALCCLWSATAARAAQAAAADWYLYVWSEQTSGDLGQFETTDSPNIYVIPVCNVPIQGIGFCVRNSTWSVMYGWSDDGGSVSATATDVVLATTSQASGWLELPVGSYKVTFNASNLTIRFDAPEPTPEPEQQTATFLRGGDLSMVTYLEDWGTVFRYHDGTPGDVFDILQSYGVNFARLRMYNQPGTAVVDGGETYRTPVKSPYNNWAGRPGFYAGPEDILNLARRAKDHDMQICLSIYLSDYWSGAMTQMIPAAWQDVSNTDVLVDSVYNYVLRIMQRMQAQGTTPEFVSVGNETNYGILFTTLSGNNVTFGGHTNNLAQCVRLFNAAYDAIKAVSPSTQVIIHHSYGHDGKISACRSFFLNLKNNGCKFDIVGGSYYPYWASLQNSPDNTPTGMLTWAADMETNIGKPVIIMEVGYSWTQYRPSEKNNGNYEGQLRLNGSYNEASEAGQESFMHQLHAAMATDDNILGYLYWDPVFVDQKVNGYWTEVCWAEKKSGNTWYQNGNVISNTTLFDYTGLPLSALYREIASYKSASDVTTAIDNHKTIESKSSAVKVIRDNRLMIIRNDYCYSVLGNICK